MQTSVAGTKSARIHQMTTPIDSFEYRGFLIGPRMSLQSRTNKLSGHAWTEKTPTNGIHISATHRRPLLIQLESNLRSIEAARREVDTAISLSYLNEVERINTGAAPHAAPYYHAYWTKVVELTRAAGLDRPSDEALNAAEPEILAAELDQSERPRG